MRMEEFQLKFIQKGNFSRRFWSIDSLGWTSNGTPNHLMLFAMLVWVWYGIMMDVMTWVTRGFVWRSASTIFPNLFRFFFSGPFSDRILELKWDASSLWSFGPRRTPLYKSTFSIIGFWNSDAWRVGKWFYSEKKMIGWFKMIFLRRGLVIVVIIIRLALFDIIQTRTINIHLKQKDKKRVFVNYK